MRDNELAAVQQLFAPLRDGAITLASGARVLVINICNDSDVIHLLSGADVSCVQPFYPDARGLEASGMTVVDAASLDGEFDYCFIHCPKNMMETHYYIALARRHLRPDGTLICAAHNKAGGTRLSKILSRFGAESPRSVSGAKCRTVWESVWSADCDVDLDAAVASGALHHHADLSAWTQLGVYGWDKRDIGSELLLRHLPDKLPGRRAADFGCGYGLLSMHVLRTLPEPYKFYVLDADKRAINATLKNCEAYTGVEPVWCDVTSASDLPRNLDFIVMNPPFHEGKKADTGIGKAFIQRASQSLRPKGKLYMVANSHLPYEGELSAHFSVVEKLHEGQGFKVYCAVK